MATHEDYEDVDDMLPDEREAINERIHLLGDEGNLATSEEVAKRLGLDRDE